MRKGKKFKDTDTTEWIGKHIPISVSISSNLISDPIFLCNSDPHELVTSFIVALDSLAAQSKAQMSMLFLDIGTTIRSKLDNILEQLNKRRQLDSSVDNEDSCEEVCASTQFLKIQKKQFLDLNEHFERYCNVLPVFGFNCAKYDKSMSESCDSTDSRLVIFLKFPVF